MTRSATLALAIGAILLQAGCGSSPSQPPPGVDPILVLNAGNNQQGLREVPLGQPLRVLIHKGGVPVEGATVTWTVTAGGGSVNPGSSVSDVNGMATTVLTLGSALGVNRVTATSPDADGTATFTAQAVEEPHVGATLVAEVPIPPDYGIHDTHVRDGIAFVAAWNTGIRIFDVGGGNLGGSPSLPKLISQIVTPTNAVAGGAQVHNSWWFHNPTNGQKRYLFVGQEGPGTVGFNASGDLHVVDVSNMAAPVAVASLRVPGAGVHNFWMDESRQVLYAAWYNGGVVAVDVSGTLTGDLSGRIIGQAFPGGAGNSYTWGVMLSGGTLYASDMLNGFYAIDPVTMVPRHTTPNVTSRYTSDLWIHGDVGYSGTWSNRGGNQGNVVYIWALGDNGVPAGAGSLTIEGIGTVSDVAVTADGRLLVTTNEGGNSGLRLYTRENPLVPVLADFYPVGQGLHTGEVAVINGRTYVFAARNPPSPALMIFDITDVGK